MATTWEFVATTWEVEVETQDGPREPPLNISFPCAIASPTPGEGGRRGRRLLASTHTGCVEGIGEWIVACRVGRGCRRGS